MAVQGRVALAVLSSVGSAVLAAGCQDSASSAVSHLPGPSFAAPSITPPALAALPTKPAVVILPPRIAPLPHVTAPQPTRVAGVPREWIPATAPRPWQWIIIHHSDTMHGNAAFIDKLHKDKGWDGIGYDFVIGNGTDSGDGQVEVGYRWTGQLTGAHTKTPDNRFNETGVGICLIGNFMAERPTMAQMRSVVKLVAYLMETYHIPADHILRHGDAKPTECPGTFMDVAEVRRDASRQLAADGQQEPANTRYARAGELLTNTPATR